MNQVRPMCCTDWPRTMPKRCFIFYIEHIRNSAHALPVTLSFSCFFLFCPFFLSFLVGFGYPWLGQVGHLSQTKIFFCLIYFCFVSRCSPFCFEIFFFYLFLAHLGVSRGHCFRALVRVYLMLIQVFKDKYNSLFMGRQTYVFIFFLKYRTSRPILTTCQYCLVFTPTQIWLNGGDFTNAFLACGKFDLFSCLRKLRCEMWIAHFLSKRFFLRIYLRGSIYAFR